MNSVGQPTASASPWIETNVSVIFRRSAAAGSAGATGALFDKARHLDGSAALGLELRESLLGQARGLGSRIRLHDTLERRPRIAERLELVLAVRDLQHRVRSLARIRELVEHGLERLQRRVVILAHVERFAKPVGRIVGPRPVRVLREVELEALARLLVAPRL